MPHSRRQILILMAIAATTTLVTTSFTSFLLTRPWCIEFESENVHRLLYGLENCGTQKSNTHPRMTRKQTRSSVDPFNAILFGLVKDNARKFTSGEI
ncbi:MAG: hypothetical protein ACFE0I_17120 [Elainellaceae cyanobacterium]